MEDTHVIATGVSELGTNTTIKIWEKTIEETALDKLPPPAGPREVETASGVVILSLPSSPTTNILPYPQSHSYLRVVAPILVVLFSIMCYLLTVPGSAEALLQERLGVQFGAWSRL